MDRTTVTGSFLAYNTVFFILGRIVPMVIAFISTPFIIRGLGIERFGVLSLAWVTVGYFSLFELGLGRASTKFVAEKLGESKVEDVHWYIWTSAAIHGFTGLLWAVFLSVVTSFFVEHVLNISPELVLETKNTFYLIAFSLPIVFVSFSFQGALEGGQRFALTSTVQAASGSATFLLPLVGIKIGFGLPGIVVLFFVLRVITLVLYMTFCIKMFPGLPKRIAVSRKIAGSLLRYGLWIALYNMLMSVVLYFDRFLIGAVVSAAALSYYVVPLEVISRLQIFPAGFAAVLFPAISMVAAYSKKDLEALCTRGLKFTLLAGCPIILAVIYIGDDILRIWLGSDFASRSALVFQILSFGMLLNALSDMLMNFFDGVGRPDLRTKIVLISAPIYVGSAWFLTNNVGIVGTAISWALRTGIILALCIVAVSRVLGFQHRMWVNNGLSRSWIFVGLAISLAVGLKTGMSVIFGETWLHGLLAAIGLLLFGWVIWHYALDSPDKNLLKTILRRFAPLRL